MGINRRDLCNADEVMGLLNSENLRRKIMSDVRTAISLMRHCAICQQGLRPVDPLCRSCWNLHFNLLKQRDLVFPEGSDLEKALALLAWPAGDLTTARLLLSLKGGANPSGFQKLAAEFIRVLDQNHFLKRFDTGAELVIVPAPPRQDGQMDHAGRWARALSELTGAPVQNLLLRGSPARDQRWLKRRERASVELLLQPGKNVDSEKIYIFVDDVMTTGATFRAARKTLGGASAIWGWFIAYRT
jgi:predicted amidophosphoribosyltransferase